MIEQAAGDGYQAVQIAVRLDAQSMLKGARAFLIMEKLGQTGDVLYAEPDAQTLEEGTFESDFSLLYLTQQTLADVEQNIASNSEIEAFVVAPLIHQPLCWKRQKSCFSQRRPKSQKLLLSNKRKQKRKKNHRR